MKKIAIAALMTMAVVASGAAKGIVKGSVIDKETGEVLEFANVQLLDKN
jgi:hypothetical protein